MVNVINPGFYSTIQDLGRNGFREYGVPISGAMDQQSSKLANALLGNDENAAVMEATLNGPTLCFNTSTTICITGADMNPSLNGHSIGLNYPISVQDKDILSFGKLEYGCRVYIAVRGGFQTEMIMNSRSMYPELTAASSIEKGAELQLIGNLEIVARSYSSVKPRTELFDQVVLEAFEGPDFHLLPETHKQHLGSKTYKVSKNNNRMGYQLNDGLNQLVNDLKNILTAPVLPGTVQLTPSGGLIVLMRDGQTTGGYPRVLQLNDVSMNVLAQKRVDDVIRFQF